MVVYLICDASIQEDNFPSTYQNLLSTILSRVITDAVFLFLFIASNISWTFFLTQHDTP